MSLIFDTKTKGEFRFKIARANGEVVTTPWNKNMLLDAGLAAGSFSLQYCVVGTSSTPVQSTDTALGSRLGAAVSAAGAGANTSLQESWVGSVYTASRTTNYSFAAGAVVGNVSEIAIYSSTSIIAANIRVRALVLDTNGNPTTITLTAADQLTVEHKVSLSIDTRPPSFVLNIGDIDYSVQAAACAVGFFHSSDGRILGYNNIIPESSIAINQLATAHAICESIALPAAGTSAEATLTNKYTPTSVTRTAGHDSALRYMYATYRISIPTPTNLPGGASIGGIAFGEWGYLYKLGRMAYLFSPALPKDSSVGYAFDATMRITVE